jgi:hypothetical protein
MNAKRREWSRLMAWCRPSNQLWPYVAELANDWIGYLPNYEGHKLGGYQVWTGLHSYAEPGTGERIADQTVAMLKELAAPN